jgi:hypothetical protein
MNRSLFLVAALFGAGLIAGCGDDGDDKTASAPTSTAKKAPPVATTDCFAAWNERASKDVKARASLSHRGDGEPDVHVGAYAGEPFTAEGETFDASGSTDSADVSVAAGDCVAVDLTGSDDAETNWVMVLNGKQWYFLDETGSHPLAKAPQKLDGEQVVAIKGFGEDDVRLEP